eukprot:12045577-Ditylum_brightwellii.AAC.1
MGLIIDFENKLTAWGKYCSISVNSLYSINDSTGVNELVGWMAGDNYKKFPDAKYKKANIEKTV